MRAILDGRPFRDRIVYAGTPDERADRRQRQLQRFAAGFQPEKPHVQHGQRRIYNQRERRQYR